MRRLTAEHTEKQGVALKHALCGAAFSSLSVYSFGFQVVRIKFKGTGAVLPDYVQTRVVFGGDVCLFQAAMKRKTKLLCSIRETTSTSMQIK